MLFDFDCASTNARVKSVNPWRWPACSGPFAPWQERAIDSPSTGKCSGTSLLQQIDSKRKAA